jgi:(p)ppGpp synthase/HD superfamily hydrolase
MTAGATVESVVVGMEKYNTLQDAIELARFAHRKQADKAGIAYIEHPMRVMKAVQAQGAMPYVQMAAVLHDVTEDTAFSCAILGELGFPEATVDIVRLVDRDASYLLYYKRNVGFGDHPDEEGFKDRVDDFYYTEIKKNPGALQVKMADIGDNLQPWRLSYLSPAKQEYLRDKYDRAIKLLTS